MFCRDRRYRRNGGPRCSAPPFRNSQTVSSHNYLHSTTIAFLKLLQRRKTCHAPPSDGSQRQRGRPAVPVRSADWKNGLHRPGVRMTLQFNHPAAAAGESDRGDAAAHVRCFGGLGREAEKRAVKTEKRAVGALPLAAAAVKASLPGFHGGEGLPWLAARASRGAAGRFAKTGGNMRLLGVIVAPDPDGGVRGRGACPRMSASVFGGNGMPPRSP